MGLAFVLSFPLNHTSATALHISTENSGSVWVKVSGLYSSCHSVFEPLAKDSSMRSLISWMCFVARAIVCSFELLNTTFLKRHEVALYMWNMALLAPLSESKVLRMRSSLAGLRTYDASQFGACDVANKPTWIHTSLGTWTLPSIKFLTKAKSVSLAAG
jgi:hypothetical protein